MSLAVSPVAVHAQEQPEPAPVDDRDQAVLGFEAKYLSELKGISIDEAYDVIKMQPRIGELQGALETRGPRAFGGMIMKYQPSFALDVLAEPNGAPTVRDAIGTLGFEDLRPFVSVRETEFTEQALSVAQQALGRVRGVTFTSSDFDLAAGRVIVSVATENEVAPARSEIRQTDMGRVPPERVDVVVGSPSEEDSYGGLGLLDWSNPSDDGCTSGFTVLHTASGNEGIATAGHCDDNEALAHHSGTLLTAEPGQVNANSTDAQWLKTPGFEDIKQFRYNDAGNTKWVYSRVDRVNMVLEQMVCKYGRSTGEGCAFIKSKAWDKDAGGPTWNATFIRMDRSITADGDSGGPWFLDTAAYGLHGGTTPCDPTQPTNNPCESYFMAQNYLSAIGVQVRIKT